MSELHTAAIIDDADLSDDVELPARKGATAGLLRITLAKIKLYLSSFLVPAGGTTGQALIKTSDVDNDVEWGDVATGGGGGGLKGLTRLKLGADQAHAWTWDAVQWDTEIEDAIGAFDPTSPTQVTVPAGVTHCRVSSLLVANGAGTGGTNEHFAYVTNVTQNSILSYVNRRAPSALTEIVDFTTGWESVAPGDVLEIHYNPGGNGASLLGGAPDTNTADTTTFARPTRAQFEWADATYFGG